MSIFSTLTLAALGLAATFLLAPGIDGIGTRIGGAIFALMMAALTLPGVADDEKKKRQ